LVLELLKEELDREPLPLLSQAEGHRTRIRQEEARAGAQIAVDRTAEVIERDVAPVLETQLDEPDTAQIPEGLPAAELASRRLIRVAAALALAEVTAREAGVALAGSIRLRVNQLLREALCNP